MPCGGCAHIVRAYPQLAQRPHIRQLQRERVLLPGVTSGGV
jgi:hypothetical protein